MVKPCILCQSKPTKDGYYKTELLEKFIKFMPKTNKLYCNEANQKIHMSKLIPNTTIFYFATRTRDFAKPIQMRSSAYHKLENSGVVKVNSKGETTIHLKCPQVYRNDDGKVYHRHVHFIYWNDKNDTWGENLFTKKIICKIDENSVKKNLKKAIIIDALPEKEYEEKHIKGSFSLPYNKRWTEEDVLKIVGKNKLKPIIVYSWNKNCDASKKVCLKLNKMEFYNLVHYENGICKWSGPTESSLKK